MLAVSLCSTGLNLFQPYISKLLIDRALVPRNMTALVEISALMLGVTLLGFLVNIASSYRYVQISAAMLFDMRLALFRHLQTLSPRFYANFRLGDLMSRLNNDVGEVQRVSADTLLSVLSNIMFLTGSIIIMLRLNWRLFLLGVVLVPACLWVFQHYQKRLTALSKLMRERSADLGSLFVDSILGMRFSIDLIVAPIIGGLGTVFGPILGAFIILPLNEFAKALGQASGINGLNLLIYGVLLLVVVLVLPNGCWPWLARRLGLSDRGTP